MIRQCLVGLMLLIAGACATAPEVTTFEENLTLVEIVEHSAINDLDTFVRAKEAFADERYDDALDLFHQIVLRDENNFTASIGYGDAAIANGQFDLALNHFNALKDKELSPEFQAKVRAGLTLAVIWSGETEDPLSLVNIALRDNPDDHRLWGAKGRLLDKYELWIDAQDAYVQALKTGKILSGTINNMGMSLLRQGRYAEAQEKFQQALELRPETRLYDNNRRMALFLQNKFLSALQDLPDDRASTLLNDAGFIAMGQAKHELAENLFEKAIETSPSYYVQAVENLEKLAALTVESAG